MGGTLLSGRLQSRRALAFGIAGLVPAAVLTALLVHQPSVGDRRLYPMLRVPLSLTGLVLAAGTVLVWAIVTDRFGRSALTGLAAAGVAALLCFGPFVESTPRDRLYALEVDDGTVAWESTAGRAPVLVGGDLVVTDVGGEALVGLDPSNGDRNWREADLDSDRATRAIDAGALHPSAADAPGAADDGATDLVDGVDGLVIEDGQLHRTTAGAEWTFEPPGAVVWAAFATADAVYLYTAVPSADGEPPEGSIVRIDADDGAHRWTMALPDELTVPDGEPALVANGRIAVVAGGEWVGAFAVSDGQLVWWESVVTLGQSRSHALPDAEHHLEIDADQVYLSSTPAS